MVALAGCGFQGLPQNGDGGNNNGQDGSSSGNDFAMSNGGTGAGPLGALQTGFCCTRDQDCAGRNCLTSGTNIKYCSIWCQSDQDCTFYTSAMHCDPNLGVCTSTPAFTACLDPSTYHYGSHATGACCPPGVMDDQYCAGGLCISSGNPNNPLYCSQGCDDQTPCPGGYTCVARSNGFLTDLRQCFMDPTAADNNATISCQ